MLAVVSTILYLFVNTDTDTKKPNAKVNLADIEAHSKDIALDNLNKEDQKSKIEEPNQEKDFIDNMSPLVKRTVGVVLALIAGLCYGETNTPTLYVRNVYRDSSDNFLDYLFSYYSGIFVTSVIYFAIYCLVKKNKPYVNPKVIFPALLSGIILRINFNWYRT